MASIAVAAGCARVDVASGVAPKLPKTTPTPTWNPARTWAFFVGVLEWEDAAFASFPQDDRKDVALRDLLETRGVPSDQIVFLRDEDATLGAIETTFVAYLRKSQPGDLLFFYFAGHGHRDDDGTTYLIQHDARSDELHDTGWRVSDIVETISREFRGDAALLTADCCYSGALGVEAKRREGRVAFAALTSAVDRESSTGAWTFTDCLIAGFSGDSRLDRDGDRLVTLGETGRFTEGEMPFVEGQLASFMIGARFPNVSVAVAEARPTARLGEHVEAKISGTWQRGTIVGIDATDGDELEVRLTGYGDDDPRGLVSIAAGLVRPFVPPQLPIGTTCEVLDEGEWWSAKVLDAKLGVHLVHYDGWKTSYDEWVTPQRIRALGAETAILGEGGQTTRSRKEHRPLYGKSRHG